MKVLGLASALFSCIAAVMDAPSAQTPVFTRPAIVAATNESQANLVFFGSSRVQNGFDPEVFDAAMAAAGDPGVHSYNLGRSDEVLPEIIVDAERFFRLRPKGTKYVLFEPNLTGEAYLVPNTRRAVELFSLHGVRLVNRMMSPYLLTQVGISGFEYARRAVLLLAQHYSGLVWAPPEYDPWFPPRGHPHSLYENGSLKPETDYADHLRAIDAYKPEPANITMDEVRLALSLARFIRGQGAVPIIVATPQYNPFVTKDFLAKLAQVCGDRGPAVLDFTSPAKYSTLFDPENRMDTDHLNIRGAGIYSQLLAQELARTLDASHDPRHFCGF